MVKLFNTGLLDVACLSHVSTENILYLQMESYLLKPSAGLDFYNWAPK